MKLIDLAKIIRFEIGKDHSIRDWQRSFDSRLAHWQKVVGIITERDPILYQPQSARTCEKDHVSEGRVTELVRKERMRMTTQVIVTDEWESVKDDHESNLFLENCLF